MLLVLEKGISEEQKNRIRSTLFENGCIGRLIVQAGQDLIGVVGMGKMDREALENLPGVEKVVKVSTAFKLVSRQMHPEDTRVQVGSVVIGGDRIAVIAGPCAVEDRKRTLEIAREVKRYGAMLFRGGAFKPRTSPYSFQGLQEEGLKILAQVREETGLGVVTEIVSPAHADMMMKYVDMVQVGARNMQNFELLKCVGRMGKPVLLKRGLASTIEEWLMSAEYILSEGNGDVILCERGIRTFEPYTRNTLDLSAVPVLKTLTHLPVVIDPSHATGIREKVSPMARAAIAAGADGLMVEVHCDPDNALSDGPQSLYPKQFGTLMRDIYVIAPVIGKQVDFGYLAKARTVSRAGESEGNLQPSAAHVGEPGTLTHKACVQYFGENAAAVQKHSFRAVFEAVKSEEVAFGVVPLENTLSGSIHENYDLLLEYDLHIVGELTIRVIHNLIAQPGTTLDTVRRVLLHSATFRQCAPFLEAHPDWEFITLNDTASAVRAMIQAGQPGDAAISSREAAKLYGMEIIEAGIEANPRNYSRFAVIGRKRIKSGPFEKSCLVFSTGHQPGSLCAALTVFADNGINLAKLESRPIPGEPWKYMFYADIEADVYDEAMSPVMALLAEKTEYLRVLGAY